MDEMENPDEFNFPHWASRMIGTAGLPLFVLFYGLRFNGQAVKR